MLVATHKGAISDSGLAHSHAHMQAGMGPVLTGHREAKLLHYKPLNTYKLVSGKRTGLHIS